MVLYFLNEVRADFPCKEMHGHPYKFLQIVIQHVDTEPQPEFGQEDGGYVIGQIATEKYQQLRQYQRPYEVNVLIAYTYIYGILKYERYSYICCHP